MPSSNAKEMMLVISFSPPEAFSSGFGGMRFCISYPNGDFLLG